MAGDRFISEIEWLLHIRVESHRMATVLKKAQAMIKLACSSESQSGLRVWVSGEAEQMFHDLGRAVEVMDSSKAKFLQGPVYDHKGYLPRGTVGAAPLEVKPIENVSTTTPAPKMVKKYGVLMEMPPDSPDMRPIKGPGRRHRQSI